MKAFVLLVIALTVLGCDKQSDKTVSGESHGDGVDSVADKSHGMTPSVGYAIKCLKKDESAGVVAIGARNLPLGLGHNHITFLIFQYANVSPNKKFMCVDDLRKDGLEMRSIVKRFSVINDIDNTDNDAPTGCAWVYPAERVSGMFIIPYVPYDKFNIKDYQISFNNGSEVSKVDGSWGCEPAGDEFIQELVSKLKSFAYE